MKQTRDPLYRRHRFLAEVIIYAVWLYFRFPLSLRRVEEMLAARRIVVSHETIRQWAEKFDREFSNRMRRRGFCGLLGLVGKQSTRQTCPQSDDHPGNVGLNDARMAIIGRVQCAASALPSPYRP